jgi:hypothetical protein
MSSPGCNPGYERDSRSTTLKGLNGFGCCSTPSGLGKFIASIVPPVSPVAIHIEALRA